MKKLLAILIMVVSIAACRKHSNPPDTPTIPDPEPQPEVDSTCGPLMQRTFIQRDFNHGDSAWLQLPCHYKIEDKSYPLVIFFNGKFEGSRFGNLSKMLKLGPPHFMADSLRFSFNVNNETSNMIVACPQSPEGFVNPLTINQIIDYLVKTYRVDTTRIYLTGLSAGAQSILEFLTDRPQNAYRIAAAVPMSTTTIDSVHKSHLNYISNASTYISDFCGRRDVQYLPINQEYVNIINQYSPGLAKFTTYSGDHNNWNPLYDLGHGALNPNIYEWMLQYHR
jgi:predicted peptidase